MAGLDGYWQACDAICAQVRDERPRDFAALLRILNAGFQPSSGAAFFPTDEPLPGALEAAGWEVHFAASYLWEARSPAGDWMHYVEGDIYAGRNRAAP
jgi:hypothetical protein